MVKSILFINNTGAHASSPELFTREGYRVDAVNDIETALRTLAENAYDIVILRENPAAAIWESCDDIRNACATPVIVISQRACTETCVKSINAGADFFLRRPFGPMELSARVRALLHRDSGQNSTVKYREIPAS